MSYLIAIYFVNTIYDQRYSWPLIGEKIAETCPQIVFGEQNIQHRFPPFKVGVLTLLFPSGSSNIDMMLPGGVGGGKLSSPFKSLETVFSEKCLS